MSDILSQDEIDKLLNAAASGAMGGGGGESGPDLEPDAVDALTGFVNHLFTAANSTVGTLIARPAQVSHGRGETAPPSEFDSATTVVLKAPFRSGFSGALCFVLEERAAATLADLILGGDGVDKTELAEGDDDAVRELFGQILGNAAPNMTSTAKTDIGFDAVTLETAKPGSLEGKLGGSKVYVCSARIKVEGVLDTDLRVTIETSKAQEMADALGGGSASSGAAVYDMPSAPAPRMSDAAPARAEAPRAYAPPSADIRNIDLILDIEVEVMVRLGNAQMPLREIQKLRPGSIVDLDKDTDALVELVVNDRVIAKGELVVVSSDHFALRVTEISSPTERIRSLGGE